MRSICKKGSVTLVAVLALCVVASASASASQLYVGGKALSGSEKLAETVKVEESVVFSIKEATNLTDTIKCTVLKVPSGEITSPATVKLGRLKFENCELTEEGRPGCNLEYSNFATEPLESKLTTGKSPEDSAEVTSQASKKFWWNIRVNEECNLIGETPISGTATLKAVKGQTEAAEQEFVGEGEASKGLEGAWREPVYITGKLKLKLASGKAWSFH